MIGVTNTMDARPEYKVTDPVPLNQDSRLVRRGNGTWRSAAWLTIQLVGSPTDVRPRFVNHDRRDFPLFFPLPSPWNRGIDVVTRSSRSRRGLERKIERDPFFKDHSFLFFFFFPLHSFLSARVEKECIPLAEMVLMD